jgi:hypothetical protein
MAWDVVIAGWIGPKISVEKVREIECVQKVERKRLKVAKTVCRRP